MKWLQKGGKTGESAGQNQTREINRGKWKVFKGKLMYALELQKQRSNKCNRHFKGH